ncbi:hypothetical protein OnM2_029068 [Erysiphe neolycopersici]|uniref:Uncharacterized protein n=1 Tax=Erysiphe neolycopersici TaxID=212602 RepID=A0A420HZW2_9PEZI|nr:hypothetical protein OnM2_029068 [Erysiphe neolycopersici]
MAANQLELYETMRNHTSLILCVYDDWYISNSQIPGPLLERLSIQFQEAHFIKAKSGILADYYDAVALLSVPHIVIYTNNGETYSEYEINSENSAEGATRLIADYFSLTRGNRRQLAQKFGMANLLLMVLFVPINVSKRYKAGGETYDKISAIPNFWESSVDNTDHKPRDLTKDK